MKVTHLLGGFCSLVLATASPLSAASPLPTAVVKTSEGDMVIELDSAAAPQAVEQFKQFVAEKVYLDSTFDQAPDGNEIQ